MKKGVICQKCGIEAPCQYVAFNYNIGALVMRFHRGVAGNLCKKCIHKQFWKHTAIDLTLGWWGMVSLVMTPIFFVGNVYYYLMAIGLPSPPPGATAPQLTPDAAARLAPLVPELFARLNKQETLYDVAHSLARTAGVTPGQVVLFATQQSRAVSAPPNFTAAARPVAPAPAIPASPATSGYPAALPVTGGAVTAPLGFPPPPPPLTASPSATPQTAHDSDPLGIHQ